MIGLTSERINFLIYSVKYMTTLSGNKIFNEGSKNLKLFQS